VCGIEGEGEMRKDRWESKRERERAREFGEILREDITRKRTSNEELGGRLVRLDGLHYFFNALRQ
jgi:hypothetical protein